MFNLSSIYSACKSSNHKLSKNLKISLDTKSTLLPWTIASIYQYQIGEASRTLKKKKKNRERRKAAAATELSAEYPCPLCERTCKSRIGLVSHTRARKQVRRAALALSLQTMDCHDGLKSVLRPRSTFGFSCMTRRDLVYDTRFHWSAPLSSCSN